MHRALLFLRSDEVLGRGGAQGHGPEEKGSGPWPLVEGFRLGRAL